jgi:hypothetical protein
MYLPVQLIRLHLGPVPFERAPAGYSRKRKRPQRHPLGGRLWAPKFHINADL